MAPNWSKRLPMGLLAVLVAIRIGVTVNDAT